MVGARSASCGKAARVRACLQCRAVRCKRLQSRHVGILRGCAQGQLRCCEARRSACDVFSKCWKGWHVWMGDRGMVLSHGRRRWLLLCAASAPFASGLVGTLQAHARSHVRLAQTKGSLPLPSSSSFVPTGEMHHSACATQIARACQFSCQFGGAPLLPTGCSVVGPTTCGTHGSHLFVAC